MKKTLLLLITVCVCFINTNAQSGKAFVKIFSNFNYDMSPEDGEIAFKEFELKKSYVGYSYKIDDQFSATISFDVGQNSGGSAYTAFLKIASLTWKYNDNITVNFGQIGTKNFKFMEKSWGKKYIYKSLQDHQKWASSADLGITIDYSVSSNLSVDMQVLNGDGYKKTQGHDGLMRGGAGIIYKIGKMSIRASRDIVPRSSYEQDNISQTINSLAGVYQMEDVKIGGEYNIQENASNIKDKKKTGISVYGDYKLSDKNSIFGRYDKISSEDEEGIQWDLDKDGMLIIFGVQREMTKGVTVAANIQKWKNATLEGEEPKIENTFYLNLEYKF